MLDLGTVRPGSKIWIPINTFDSNDPSASVTATDWLNTDCHIHKDGGATQRASSAGETLTIDFDTVTGNHLLELDLADNTTANFYEAGSTYHVRIEGVTIDAGTINAWVAQFKIGFPGAILDTTIATLASQVSFTLEDGSTDDDAYNGMVCIVSDLSTLHQIAKGIVSDYTGSTKTITLDADPGVFTMAAGDSVSFFVGDALNPTARANLETACDNYSATRGLAGTALPAAAADAAGGLAISDAGGLDLDAILVDTNSLNDTKIPDTISLANIYNEVATGIVTYGLDHLVSASVAGADVTDDSIIAQLVSSSATADWDTFDNTTDSLQSIRDRGDAAWTTGAGGADRMLLQETTIATLASQTSFTLTAGSADDGAYVGCTIVIEDAATATQKAVGVVDSYTGATRTIGLLEDPGIFTMAATDNVYIMADKGLKSTAQADYHVDVTAGGTVGIDWANVENPTTAVDLAGTDIQLCDTVTTLTGHTAQTADHTANIAAILTDTAEIGAAGAGLTAIPWNSSWDAEVESECADALVSYGLDHLISSSLPTNWSTDVAAGSVFAEIGGATFDTSTDSQEAIRNHVGDGTNLTEAGGTGDHLTAVPWNNAGWDAEVQSEVDDALVARGLHFVVNTALPTSWTADITANSALDYIADDGTATYDRTTDSLQAQLDNYTTPPTAAAIADAVWDETQASHVTAGTFGETATEIATIASDVTAILVDTGTLDTDWADGGRLDLILDQIAADLPHRIVKNSAVAVFPFKMVESTDLVTGVTGLTSITGTVSIDGGAFVSLTNTASEITSGGGWYRIALDAADTNGDCLILRFVSTGNAADREIVVFTQPT